MFNRILNALGYFLVVKVLAKVGIFLAPVYPIKVDRVRDYFIEDHTGEPMYRHNAHQIMESNGQTTCGNMHSDDYHPGTVYGCIACDVEGMCYLPMSLITRMMIGTRHDRTLQEAMYI